MIEFVLTDDLQTSTLPRLERNVLTLTILEGATDVETADNNVSTYVSHAKKQFSHTWTRLTLAQFNIIKGFYTRQTNLNVLKFPLLTITDMGISNIPVRMYLDEGSVIDNCQDRRNVTVTFRETTNQ